MCENEYYKVVLYVIVLRLFSWFSNEFWKEFVKFFGKIFDDCFFELLRFYGFLLKNKYFCLFRNVLIWE